MRYFFTGNLGFILKILNPFFPRVHWWDGDFFSAKSDISNGEHLDTSDADALPSIKIDSKVRVASQASDLLIQHLPSFLFEDLLVGNAKTRPASGVGSPFPRRPSTGLRAQEKPPRDRGFFIFSMRQLLSVLISFRARNNIVTYPPPRPSLSIALFFTLWREPRPFLGQGYHISLTGH
jgi:hypothetical protein